MATVSARALKRRLPAAGSLAHEGMSPQRKGVSTRERVSGLLSGAPGPDADHLVGGGDVPAGGRFVLVAVVEDGLEVAGQAGRWGDEREASTHESCIVAQWHLGRDLPRRHRS